MKFVKYMFLSWMMGLAGVGCGGSPASPPAPVSSPAPSPKAHEDSPKKNHAETAEDPSPARQVSLIPFHQLAQKLSLQIWALAPSEEVLQGNLPPADSERPPHILSSSDDRVTDGDKLEIHRKLFLADPNSPNPENKKEIFFVWSEDSLGSKITVAHYTHQAITKLGEKESRYGNLDPRPVWHDPERRLWFIPLAHLFSLHPDYNQNVVRLEDTQFLNLSLVLENGQKVVVYLQFQVSGALSQVQVVDSTPVPDPTPRVGDLIQSLPNQGWVLKRESLTNPASRPYTLWFRTGAVGSLRSSSSLTESVETALRLKTVLSKPTYERQFSAPPLGPNYVYYQTTGLLEVSRLEVFHGNGEKETFSLNEGQWASVTLRPLETLELRWMARPAMTTLTCQLPPPSTEDLSWQKTFERTYHLEPASVDSYWEHVKIFPEPVRNQMLDEIRKKLPPVVVNDPVREPERHIVKVEIKWESVAAQFEGKWNREIRLAHSFTAEEEATRIVPSGETGDSKREYLVLASETFKQTNSVGQVPDHLENLNCQGIIREQ
jgi:hypothetical protein